MMAGLSFGSMNDMAKDEFKQGAGDNVLDSRAGTDHLEWNWPDDNKYDWDETE
jgi:hypothetical protein